MLSQLAFLMIRSGSAFRGSGKNSSRRKAIPSAVEHSSPSRTPAYPVPTQTSAPSAINIERHRTALSRRFLSAPVQALLRHGILEPGKTVFDYGCGRGDDISGLASLGYTVLGWDPHFRADSALQKCDVVNLGFVINVIEDMDERISALKDATMSPPVLLPSRQSSGRAPLPEDAPIAMA